MILLLAEHYLFTDGVLVSFPDTAGY